MTKELLLEISYDCNFRCIHCSSTNCHGRIELEDIPNVDDISVIRISGGEPTLQNDLSEYIKFFKYQNKKVILQTNGMNNLDNDIIDNIDEIWVSLYGTEVIHDFITMRQGSFNITNRFIDRYKKCKHVVIQSPIFGFQQAVDVVKIAESHKVDIRLSALVNQGRCNFAKELWEQIWIANEIKEICHYKIILPCSLSNTRCEFDDKLVMKPDGSLFNCASHKQGMMLCKR